MQAMLQSLSRADGRDAARMAMPLPLLGLLAGFCVLAGGAGPTPAPAPAPRTTVFQQSYRPPMRSTSHSTAQPTPSRDAHKSVESSQHTFAPDKSSGQRTESAERERHAPSNSPSGERNISQQPSSAAKPVGERVAEHGNVTAPPVAVSREIPSEIELGRSRDLMKVVYAKQLKDESIAGRRQLAGELIAEAKKSSDNRSDHYVLLSGAIQAAREARHLRHILEALEAMALYYDFDLLAAKWELARDMVYVADLPIHTHNNVRAGLELVDQMVAAGDYADALRLCERLLAPASDDPALENIVRVRMAEVDALVKMHHASGPAAVIHVVV